MQLTRLLPALALALVAAGGLGAEPGRAASGERLAVVALTHGGGTAYSGPGRTLTRQRGFRAADRAVLSPDARLLAYTRLREGRTEIRVTGIGGTRDRLLARVRPYDIALAFSPDGSRLAYSSAAGIATVRVDGRDPRRLRLPAAWRGSRYPHLLYAPDGRRLFASRTSGDGRKGTLRNELAAVELASRRGTTLFRSSNAYDVQARPTSFSPDGAYVALDGTGAIRTVSTARGTSSALTTPPRNTFDHSPLVSPDGRYIAFARSPFRGVSDVYVLGYQGFENPMPRRVTTTPIPPRGTAKVGSTPLAWSPDSTKLLVFRHDRFAIVDVTTRRSVDVRRIGIRYAIPSARWVGTPPEPSKTGTIVFERGGDTGDLYTVRADGTGLRRLTSDGRSHDPAWSPDGDRIAYTVGRDFDRQLFVMNADGSAAQQLTRLGERSSVWEPSWFPAGPTGLSIAFAWYTRNATGGGSTSDLYAIGIEGGTPMPLVNGPEDEWSASFSGHGRLAYQDSRTLVVRADGVTRRLGEGSEPQWSPDGRRLVYTRGLDLNGGLIVVAAPDGTGPRAVAWGWNPSWSPDGSSIVYGAQGGLYTTRADGLGLPRRLTSGGYGISPSWTSR